MRRFLVSAALIVCVCAAVAEATEPTLEVQLDPRQFGIEDTSLIVVRILDPEGTPVVDLGPLENLEVISGPSTKQEFSWINGAASRSVSFSYAVQGQKVGDAAIGPVTVTLGDTVLSSEIVRAEVVPGSIVPQRRSGRRSPFPFDPFEDLVQRRQPTRAAKVVLRQLVNLTEVVLGQSVRTTVVLDTTAGGVDGFEWVSPPSYPGWWTQRVEPPERVTGEVVEVEGVRYNRFVVARHVLVPLKVGQLEIPTIEARIGFRTAGLFAPQQVVERATRSISIAVSPRSRPPEGYSGAVGDLSYSARLAPETIEFGESAVLTIELRGSGNLPLVEAPALWPICSDCESYPPEEESDVAVDANGIHGSREWRTTLVPRIAGEIELAPVILAVFDPSVGHYRRQTLGPLRLVVEPPPAAPTPSAVLQEVVETGEPAAAEGPTAANDEPGLQTWVYIVGALIVGVALGGVVPLLAARRRGTALPSRQAGESPAERARVLQVALERWWMDARARAKGRALEDEMKQVRSELEAIRFAPGRADHSDTVLDLEERMRSLMRQG